MNNKFNTFSDVKDTTLRAYNRVAMAYNLREDFSVGVMEEYFNMFDEDSKKQMLVIILAIKAKGLDEVKKEVMKQTVLED